MDDLESSVVYPVLELLNYRARLFNPHNTMQFTETCSKILIMLNAT